MSNLVVIGGKQLSGTITPSGNKNSVLPIICASLLTNEDVILHNVPDLVDVNKLVEEIKSIGTKVDWDKKTNTMKLNSSGIDSSKFDAGFPLGMRGAVLLFAPLLGRLHKMVFCNEIGGCSLGVREIDPHLDALESLGVKVVRGRILRLSIKDHFVGGNFWPDYMSVTTTENFVNAAVLAKGKSKITNAASEPHVQDLCEFLIQMGAKITGIGSSILEIEGVKELHGTEYTINSDHHEITTMLAIGAMTGGEVHVKNALPEKFVLINRAFHKLGVEIEYEGNTAIVRKDQKLIVKNPFTETMMTKIEAAPWPYFPVDLLPLFVALAVKSKGKVLIWNKVYEAGMFWIQELQKFGTEQIMADPHRVIVFGGRELIPANVNAPNIIRVAIALTMIALTIDGKSTIFHADTIKRAHPDFEMKLKSLGARVEWKDSPGSE